MVWSSSKKLKVELSYDPAILLQYISEGIEISVLRNHLYSCISASLFTTAKIWSQLKLLSIDECIKKTWYIYTMEYYSALKNERNPAIYDNNLEDILLSEIS
jgi:hypothetical protein